MFAIYQTQLELSSALKSRVLNDVYDFLMNMNDELVFPPAESKFCCSN